MAVVNVPLKADFAALRVAAFRDREGGFVDVVGAAAGKNTNGGDTTGGRVALLVEPSARFHVRATALTQDIQRRNADFTWTYDAATGKPVDDWGVSDREEVMREPYSMRTSLGSVDLEVRLRRGAPELDHVDPAHATWRSDLRPVSAVYSPLINAVLRLHAGHRRRGRGRPTSTRPRRNFA